jgi:effector-binding domain-containing protein
MLIMGCRFGKSTLPHTPRRGNYGRNWTTKSWCKTNRPCFTIDHDEEYKESDLDLEVCEPVVAGTKLNTPFEVKSLPAVKEMASLIHQGSFQGLNGSYQKLLRWLEENKYQIAGPGREIYISTGERTVQQDNESYITEIQFPVKKA